VFELITSDIPKERFEGIVGAFREHEQEFSELLDGLQEDFYSISQGKVEGLEVRLDAESG